MSLLDRAYRDPRLREALKRLLPHVLPRLPAALRARLRLGIERTIYRNTPAVHALPPAFHHWSAQWLRPRLQPLGFDGDESFYAHFIAGLPQSGGRRLRVVSLGSGAATLELAVWRALADRGIETDFECVELNPQLQAQAAAHATRVGAGPCFTFHACRAEEWRAQQPADAILANQFLHHVEDVAALLRRVHAALAPHGRLITHDVIGRNGHQLWPGARAVVEALWARLPDARRRERSGRLVVPFRDHDCAAYSLEGIEAERILPALLQQFHTRLFFGYGGFALSFLDRRFGHNFDPQRAEDRAFIEHLGMLDWQLLDTGVLAPTQMFGVFCRELAGQGTPQCNLDPQAALAARATAPAQALAALHACEAHAAAAARTPAVSAAAADHALAGD